MVHPRRAIQLNILAGSIDRSVRRHLQAGAGVGGHEAGPSQDAAVQNDLAAGLELQAAAVRDAVAERHRAAGRRRHQRAGDERTVDDEVAALTPQAASVHDDGRAGVERECAGGGGDGAFVHQAHLALANAPVAADHVVHVGQHVRGAGAGDARHLRALVAAVGVQVAQHDHSPALQRHRTGHGEARPVAVAGIAIHLDRAAVGEQALYGQRGAVRHVHQALGVDGSARPVEHRPGAVNQEVAYAGGGRGAAQGAGHDGRRPALAAQLDGVARRQDRAAGVVHRRLNHQRAARRLHQASVACADGPKAQAAAGDVHHT